MEIVRLTEVHNDEGQEYEREETLDGCYYWSAWEERPLAGTVDRVPLSPESAERMEARRNGKLEVAGFPGLIELRAEIIADGLRLRRREVMHGGVLWDRAVEHPGGWSNRPAEWRELDPERRDRLEEEYQAEYPDDIEEDE